MVIGTSAPCLARIAVAASIVVASAIALAAPASAQTRRVPGREGIELREFQRPGDAYRRVPPGMQPCIRGYEPGCFPGRRPGIPTGRIQLEPPPCIPGTPGAIGTWALQGTLLTPDKVISNGTIVIAGQKIAAVVAADGNIPTVGRGVAPPCPLELNAIILPGFIDLHNHLTWNILPRWHPFGKFFNRADWQGDPNSDPKLNADSEYEKNCPTPIATSRTKPILDALQTCLPR